MPNSRQAAKRNRQRDRRHLRNRLVLGAMRTRIRTARAAIREGAPDVGDKIKEAISAVDSAVTKGSLQRRTASRYISRLVRASQS